MIFVTVGAQMSFDRLIEWVDRWAEERGRSDVVAQLGPSEYTPRHLEVAPFLAPPEFRSHLERADVVVAHAGMGSILNALELGKPIIVVPRYGARNETRNDHQVATAHRLGEEGLVTVAETYEDLREALDHIDPDTPTARIAREAQPSLVARIREFAVEAPTGS